MLLSYSSATSIRTGNQRPTITVMFGSTYDPDTVAFVVVVARPTVCTVGGTHELFSAMYRVPIGVYSMYLSSLFIGRLTRERIGSIVDLRLI